MIGSGAESAASVLGIGLVVLGALSVPETTGTPPVFVGPLGRRVPPDDLELETELDWTVDDGNATDGDEGEATTADEPIDDDAAPDEGSTPDDCKASDGSALPELPGVAIADDGNCSFSGKLVGPGSTGSPEERSNGFQPNPLGPMIMERGLPAASCVDTVTGAVILL